VRVSTQDRNGAVASQTLTLNVLPPPVNPYPKLVKPGVYRRTSSCGFESVLDGSTVNLTLPPICGGGLANFYAQTDVENPSGEALTYEWKQIVQYQGKDTVFSTSTGPTLALTGAGGGFNNGGATTPCRVTLTVNAPDPSRSKTLTVWSGQCTYYTFRLA
jgi:hypothetical protein